MFLVLLCICILPGIWTATHDELPQCGLTGVYKTRQSVLESPNYPDNYTPNTCWDYVVRSPYRCPTKFHIQFLDFFLESSQNCTNDYLAIGLENDGDDMDLLCGQVIGIKKYHTPDGVLRLRFFADESPWTTGKGFKLLVTRLACEREDLLRDKLDSNDADSEVVNAPPLHLQPPGAQLPEIFRNLSLQDQHRPYPVPPLFSWNIPNQLPLPPYPGFGGLYLPVTHFPHTSHPAIPVQEVNRPPVKEKPCDDTKSKEIPKQPQGFYLPIQGYQNNQPLPELGAQYPTNPWQPQPSVKDTNQENLQQYGNQLISPSSSEPCCASSFRQKRFYLSSPGFPRTVFTALLPTQQRDCQFYLEKSMQNVCRLRIEFKFFDFGQPYTGTGAKQGNIDIAIATAKDVCTDDFLEIDGERFCGCRSGYVHTTLWGLGKKVLRMRMGYSGIPSNGFLLEIFQEECRATQFLQPQIPGENNGLQQNGPNALGNNPYNPGQVSGIQQNGFSSFGNQQNQAHNIGLPQNGFSSFGNQQTNFQNNDLNGFGIQQTQGFPVYAGGQQNTYPLQQTIFGQQQQQQQQSLPPYQPSALYQPGQSNGFLQQQQQPYQPFSNNLSPTQHFWTPTGQLTQYPLQVPPYRQGRSLDIAKAESAQQPLTVVETNSTRKEYYYYDGDETFARARLLDEPDDVDRKRINTKMFTYERNRCTFGTTDVLGLSIDTLWLTKPTCYAPQGSWFTNIFG